MTENREAAPDDKRERLATYAHSAWSGWMDYLFGKCVYHVDGKVVIPQKSVERWTRQMMTAYQDLPETEKASDRAEADKMLAIVEAAPAEPEETFADRLDSIATELNHYAFGKNETGERYPEWEEIGMAFGALERAVQRLQTSAEPGEGEK